MGDEKDGADGPCVEVVVQDEKIGSSVFENGALHFGVSGVDNSGAKRSRLAFQLERGFARGTEVVHGDGVARRHVEPWRFAGGTEEVGGSPGFGADAGALRGAFVTVETSRRKVQFHAGIRSRATPEKIYTSLRRSSKYIPEGVTLVAGGRTDE
jgi:hypothetical protein